MPRPKKNKGPSKKAAKTLAVKQPIHNQQNQIFFDAVDEKVLKASPVKDRIKQLEEQEKLCEELQKKAGLEKISFQEILSKEIDEEMPQGEMTQLKELQDQISFYEELSEDLKKLQTATKELFQALEEDHTNQEELKLLMQKIKLLESLKYFIDIDTLFNYIYRLLKEHGVSKKTLQDMLKQEKLPQLKTAKMSSTIGDAAEKEAEEQHWGKVFPFTVLGFNNNHEIKISHKGQIKTISITGARQGILSLYVGINNEKNDDQLTEILIGLAHKEGNIDDQNTIKTGIDFLEREKKFLVVSGTSFFKVSPKDLQIEKLQKPVVDGKLIEGDRYKNWINTKQIRKADLKKTFEKVHKHLQQWQWEEENMSNFFAAFLMLYPFHKLLHYRPWLYLLGSSQSGKTTLIEGFLMPLYSSLVMKMDKSTAHSTAQEIGNTAIIPIFDEFEKFKRLEEILELFKMTSAKGGGVKKSGTPGKEPLRFEIKQMPMFASIYTPASIKGDFAQDNRTLIFKLRKNKGHRKAPRLFNKTECEELEGDIISSIISNWNRLSFAVKEIEDSKEEIVKSHQNKITSRTVNNFCYPLALMQIVNDEKKLDISVPEWACEDAQRDDGDRVVSDLLHARVSHEGREYLILDLVYAAVEGENEEEKQILRKNGITPAISQGAQVIAFDSKQIKKTVFKQDDYYKKLHIGDVLERIPGAKKNQPTHFGSGDVRRVLQVPFNVIKEVAQGGVIQDAKIPSSGEVEENIQDESKVIIVADPEKKASPKKPSAKKEETKSEKKKDLITDPLKYYGVSHEYIASKDQISKALELLIMSQTPIALDIETFSKKEEYGKRGGLDPHVTEIRLMQCYVGKGPIFVFDLQKVSLDDFPANFWNRTFVCHNALFELQHLLERGKKPIKVDCTLLMEHTLTGKPISFGLSLKSLCEKYLKIDLSKEQQMSDWSIRDLSEEQIAYAAIDSLVTFKLAEILLPKLDEQKKHNSYYLKRDAQFSIAKMKISGLPINENKHLGLIESWKKQKVESEEKLKQELGNINPNSSKQLNEWLKTNIDKAILEKWKRTGSGAYQTSGDVLKYHKDYLPWWEAHRNFKKVDKRLNNYGQKMIDLKSPVTKRIHSDIFIAGTDTGRLSSANPNCQNFPRDEEFRKIFEAPESKKLIVADYSQVELRVAAIVANDWVMLKAYENGEDLHRKTAAFVAGIKEEEVTKEERQKAKAVNFGFLFGMGAERFVDYARDSYGVDLTLEDSKRARDRFFDTYRGISIWHRQTRREVEKTYKSSTPMGFVRYFDRSTAAWKMQNEALNTPVQGGAAEATLKALYHIGKELDWERAQIINCIHDEIILESDDDYVETASKILEKGMIQGFIDVFPKATIKKLVEVGVGQNWVEAK